MPSRSELALISRTRIIDISQLCGSARSPHLKLGTLASAKLGDQLDLEGVSDCLDPVKGQLQSTLRSHNPFMILQAEGITVDTLEQADFPHCVRTGCSAFYGR